MSTRAGLPKHRFLNRVAREWGAPRLSNEWRAWIVENALRSVSREDLLVTLVENGVPRAVGAREIDEALRSPIFSGAERVARRAKRHELRANLERATAKLASEPRTIERRSRLSRDEFFARYYATGTPVVVTDTFDTWPLLADWSPESFAKRFADVKVTATTDRSRDPATHTHFGYPPLATTMADFVARVAVAQETNDFYLISDEFDRDALVPLLEDLRPLHPYLADERHRGFTILWFGPRGTVTPLHHDTKNVFLCQAFGRKHVILFPRFELPLLGARADTVYSPVDMDRAVFPELGDALRKDVVLSPGEALFIPVGCFHQMRALDVSISIGFSNLRAKNRFEWFTPGKVE